MKRVPLARASGSLAKYAAELDDDIVVVTRGRRAVAALVPLANVDRESLALSTSPEFLRLMKRARVEIAGGKSLLLKEMRARVLPAKKASKPARQRALRARRARAR